MKITTVGIDLAKSVFQVHAVDERGRAVLRKQLRRDQMTAFFANLPPCLIGMEACASAHHWARTLQKFGHTVRLMAPQFVKPYVKTNKNDVADAEAICEAVGRPNMRFVPIKSVEQQAVLALRPGDVGTMIQLGLAEKAAGRLGIALSWFRTAVAREGQSSLLHFYLGEVLYNQGAFDDARSLAEITLFECGLLRAARFLPQLLAAHFPQFGRIALGQRLAVLGNAIGGGVCQHRCGKHERGRGNAGSVCAVLHDLFLQSLTG